MTLDVQTLLHFAQVKAWTNEDWEAPHSICLLCLSYAALCLSVSSLRLAFLTDKHRLPQSEPPTTTTDGRSHLCKLSLQLVYTRVHSTPPWNIQLKKERKCTSKQEEEEKYHPEHSPPVRRCPGRIRRWHWRSLPASPLSWTACPEPWGAGVTTWKH